MDHEAPPALSPAAQHAARIVPRERGDGRPSRMLPERFRPDLGHPNYAREYLRALSDLLESGARFRFEHFREIAPDAPGEPLVASVTVYVEAQALNDAHVEVRRRLLAADSDYTIRMPRAKPPRSRVPRSR